MPASNYQRQMIHDVPAPSTNEIVHKDAFCKKYSPEVTFGDTARKYLQLPLRQWGADNVYLLGFSSWKVNIAENPIAVMGL